MDLKEKIEKLAANGEDRLLLAKVADRLGSGQRRNVPTYTSFLTLREQRLVQHLMGNGDTLFFGGHPGTERAIACYLPEYLEEGSLYGDDGPIVCLRATFYEKDKLTHRDFLGALVGCGVKRETVGDICVGQGGCDFFLLREVAPYVEQNLLSAGRTKLHLLRIPLEDAQIPIPETDLRRDTLASLRLDSVIGAGFRISRGLAVKHIQAGGTAIDGLPTLKPDKPVEQGAVISVRGLGKIRLTAVKGETKKGRIAVEIEKFI